MKSVFMNKSYEIIYLMNFFFGVSRMHKNWKTASSLSQKLPRIDRRIHNVPNYIFINFSFDIMLTELINLLRAKKIEKKFSNFSTLSTWKTACSQRLCHTPPPNFSSLFSINFCAASRLAVSFFLTPNERRFFPNELLFFSSSSKEKFEGRKEKKMFEIVSKKKMKFH